MNMTNTFITRWSNLTPIGVVVTRCEVLVAALFLVAAKEKLLGAKAPELFANSVKAFKMFDPESGIGELGVRFSTSVTPWIEFVAALLLLLGIWSRAAAAVLSIMLVAFIAIILRAINNGYDLHCGCFGKLSPFCPEKVGWCNIVQNSVMLAGSLIVALTPRSMLARAARPA
ncbi:MAG: DoxX family protein [Phycisphaerales bacterium]|nr:DoxX family protein [Phycisphaerales bacterium]